MRPFTDNSRGKGGQTVLKNFRTSPKGPGSPILGLRRVGWEDRGVVRIDPVREYLPDEEGVCQSPGYYAGGKGR